MSNWTQGEVTFAQAIGLGKYVQYKTLTPQLPGQVEQASNTPTQNSGSNSPGATPSPTPGSSPTPSNSTQTAFFTALLASIGAPATQANLDSLNKWTTKESVWPGGPNKGGMYNPLNTTLRLPGSTNYNSIGVQNYLTPTQGVQGTSQTMLQWYPAIVSALKSGKGLCGNSSIAAELKKWSGAYTSVC